MKRIKTGLASMVLGSPDRSEKPRTSGIKMRPKKRARVPTHSRLQKANGIRAVKFGAQIKTIKRIKSDDGNVVP